MQSKDKKQQQPQKQQPTGEAVDFNKLFIDLDVVFKNGTTSPAEFTRNVVSHFEAQNLNVFVCHPTHECDNYDGKHHYDLKQGLIHSKGFDIYLAYRGKQTNMIGTNFGDGGEANWGFGGKFTRIDQTIKYE